MRVAVYTKPSLDKHTSKKNLLDKLSSLGCFDFVESDLKEIPEGSEKLLVFGGDGTMLYAATHCNLPILGINLGNMGFLAEFEENTPCEQIADALYGGEIVNRGLLCASIQSGDKLIALNDVTFKSADSRPIRMKLYVDETYVDSYHADGLIVCTSTGSTAYSLSAGGPVVAPDVDALVINPVCPHSLHSRALIISGSSKVEVVLDGAQGVLIVDGNNVATLVDGTRTVVSKTTESAQFIVAKKNTFYEKLLKKMNRWGTTQ